MPYTNKNSIVENCRLHHVTIQARDWDASLRLYRDVLGMQVVAEFGSPDRRILLLDVGDGSHVELVAPGPGTPPVGSPAANDPLVHLALGTTDARAALEQVREGGYEITVEPKTVQLADWKATVAFFNGPNGEVIEFFQMH
jgi:catechol 2,3-dioxygenase-like lactoylglutathione lyase family enzyme